MGYMKDVEVLKRHKVETKSKPPFPKKGAKDGGGAVHDH